MKTPSEILYDDFFFSPQDGLGETRYVFHEGNRLGERFAEHPQRSFVIGELGFGAGLNFVATLSLWIEKSPPSGWLTYISTELHPLTVEQIQTRLAPFSQTQELKYPIHTLTDALHACGLFIFHSGPHLILFPEYRTKLILLTGDASEQLRALHPFQANAWFFDGFSPAKNPALWKPELFQICRALSANNATFASFSAAGQVRRDLAAAGFCVSKRPGFGKKRECIAGTVVPAPNEPQEAIPSIKPPKHVNIVGAGVVGAATARAFAHRNIKSTVFEQAKEVATAASGNPRGLVAPILSSLSDTVGGFSALGFEFANQRLNLLSTDSTGWQASGLDIVLLGSRLKTKYPPSLAKALQWKFNSEENLISISQGGSVSPRNYVQALTEHENIELRLNTKVHSIHDLNPSEDIPTVFCCAHGAHSFPELKGLNLNSIRGQIVILPKDPHFTHLTRPLYFDGYLIPNSSSVILGATFDRDNLSCEPNLKSTQELLEKLTAIASLSGFTNGFDTTQLNHPARASLRVTTLDTLPVIGQLPNFESVAHVYRDLWKGNPRTKYESYDFHENIYLNTAYGSRGVVNAEFGAELLAALVLQEPLPVPLNFSRELDPVRFMLRSLRKKSAN